MEQKECQKCGRQEKPFYKSTGVTIPNGLYCWECIIDSVILYLENAIEGISKDAEEVTQQ